MTMQVIFANDEQDEVTYRFNYAESNTGNHIAGGGGDASGDNSEIIVAHHETGSGGTELVIERDEELKETSYEIRFPARSIGRTNFRGGMKVAIGVCVNDGDTDPGQEGQKGWSVRRSVAVRSHKWT
jgi:hypothetical protein